MISNYLQVPFFTLDKLSPSHLSNADGQIQHILMKGSSMCNVSVTGIRGEAERVLQALCPVIRKSWIIGENPGLSNENIG